VKLKTVTKPEAEALGHKSGCIEHGLRALRFITSLAAIFDLDLHEFVLPI
jgi:hypothetical protein